MFEHNGDSCSGRNEIIMNISDEERRLIKEFIKESYAGDKSFISLVRSASEIPWGEGRKILDVLRDKKVGTCTGKHLVLQACMDELGVEYRPVVGTFRWENQGINFPEHLKTFFEKDSWVHGHNFVQVKNSANEWIDLDITWDSELSKYGFGVLPDEWSGEYGFVALDIDDRWDGVDIYTKKEELISMLSVEQRKNREEFLSEFIAWIESIRG